MFSPFEALMIACFGAAWPVSIWKSFTSRRNEGKSFLFLWVIFAGYLSGVLHKVLFNFDIVIALYVANAVMVFIDICLYIRNGRIAAQVCPTALPRQ